MKTRHNQHSLTIRNRIANPFTCALSAAALFLVVFADTVATASDQALIVGSRALQVDDYGARANDRADDTAAVRRALAVAAQMGGATIEFGAGTYLLNPQATTERAALTITQGNIELVGKGATATTLQFRSYHRRDADDYWLLENGQVKRPHGIEIKASVGQQLPNITVRGLSLHGGARATGNSGDVDATTGDGRDYSHSAIVVSDVSTVDGFSLNDVVVEAWRGDLVVIQGSQHRNITISNSALQQTNGFAITSDTALTVTNNQIKATAMGGIDLKALGGRHSEISGNTIAPTEDLPVNGKYGLRVSNDAGSTLEVRGNTVRGATDYGLALVRAVHDASVRDNLLEDCGAQDHHAFGYVTIDLVPQDGFAARNVVIANNTIRHHATAQAGFVFSLQEFDPVQIDGVRIEGNQASATTSSGGYRLFLADALADANAQRTNLVITGNAAEGLQRLAEDSGKHILPSQRAIWQENHFTYREYSWTNDAFGHWEDYGMLDIAPVAPRAVITYVPRNGYPVCIHDNIERYPDGFELTLVRTDDAEDHTMAILPDSSWNTLESEVIVRTGDELTLIKENGKFRLKMSPHQEVLNVLDFGAVPNDGIDDTAAIRAALAAAASDVHPNAVYLPAGNYLVMPQSDDETAALTIAQSDLLIYGDGPDLTRLSVMARGGLDPENNWHILNQPGHPDHGLPVRGHGIEFARALAIENITLRDFQLSGNTLPTGKIYWEEGWHRADGWDISHKAVMLGNDRSTDNTLIERVWLDGWRGEIIYGGGSGHGRLHVTDCKLWNTNASALSTSSDLIMEGCEVWDVVNACVESMHLNIAGGKHQHGVYRNNTFDPRRNLAFGGLHGIVVGTWPDSSLTIENNSFGDVAGNAIYLIQHAENVSIRNNTFANAGLSGNSWHGYISAEFDNRYGDFDAVMHNIRIVDNMVHHTDAETPAGYFFNLSSFANVDQDDVLVARNTITASPDSAGLTYFMWDALAHAEATRTNFVVRNNTAERTRWFAIDVGSHILPAIRPLLIENNVVYRELLWQQDQFAVSDTTTTELQLTSPNPEIVITGVPTAQFPVSLAAHADRYPEGTMVTIAYIAEAAATTHSLALHADSAWNRFGSNLTIEDGMAVVLEKVNGKFQVNSWMEEETL